MQNITAISQCVTAPGLAIHGASSPLVKYANNFLCKVNGQLTEITAADAPSLVGATLVAPFPNTVPLVAGSLANGSGRVYTLVMNLPEAVDNPTPVFSWLASADFTSPLAFNTSNFPRPSDHNDLEVGYVVMFNSTGAPFVPGTTDLDVSDLTTTYVDNYAQVGA